MPRLHLFEIHEADWCPDVIRKGTTSILQIIANTLPSYNHITPQMMQALHVTNKRRIVDLCSGSGGPWLKIAAKMEGEQADVEHITLTDMYPNPQGFLLHYEKQETYPFSYVENPVDARAVPENLVGLRTIFAAFHHFQKDDAQAILKDAVRKGEAIAIYELTERNLLTMFFIVLASPFFVWLGLPSVRPFRWDYLVWGYLIPVLPFSLMFDGLVSCMRTYSIKEMHDLVSDPELQTYDWQIGREQPFGTPMPVVYMVGTPKQSA